MPDVKPIVTTDLTFQHRLRAGETLVDGYGERYITEDEMQLRTYGIAGAVDYYSQLPSVWETWFAVGTIYIVRYDQGLFTNGLYVIVAVGSGREWAYLDDLDFQTASEIEFDATSTLLTSTNVRDAIEELANWPWEEMAQDAVGSILVDSSTIDFTYNDGVPSITASVIAGSISDVHIADYANIDWAKIDKTGSSLSHLDDVNAASAQHQVPAWTGTEWTPKLITNDNVAAGAAIEWSKINTTGSVIADIDAFSTYNGLILLTYGVASELPIGFAAGEVVDRAADNTLDADDIIEITTDAGVTVDGVLLKDYEVTANTVYLGSGQRIQYATASGLSGSAAVIDEVETEIFTTVEWLVTLRNNEGCTVFKAIAANFYAVATSTLGAATSTPGQPIEYTVYALLSPEGHSIGTNDVEVQLDTTDPATMKLVVDLGALTNVSAEITRIGHHA